MSEKVEVFIPAVRVDRGPAAEIDKDEVAGWAIKVAGDVVGNIQVALETFYRHRREPAKRIYLGRGTFISLKDSRGVLDYVDLTAQRPTFAGRPIYVVQDDWWHLAVA